MIALWSRAIRNPGTCRCLSCVSNASAATRRVGGTGLRGAWAFGTPTSTFAYTVVFAAGLAIDARAKHNRNAQWDAAFASLRDQVRRTSTKAGNDGSIYEDGQPMLEDWDWDAVYQATGMELVDDPAFEKPRIEPHVVDVPEIIWDLLSADARFPGPSMLEWLANTGPDLGRRYNLPPQSLWSLESVRWKTMRNRQTGKKLAIQELSVCHLIHDLLSYFEEYPCPVDAFNSLSPHIGSVARLPEDKMINAKRKIQENMLALELVKWEDWPENTTSVRKSPKLPAEPHYFQDEDGDYHHLAAQMNAAIKNIFDEHQGKNPKPKDVGFAIGRICHNLLISSAAPNLQTFNILLAGFQKWKQHRLVNNVIRALDNCKIRPNEISCAVILDHYAETNRPDCFSRFVAKMRGIGDALMLANPSVSINEAAEGRLVSAGERKIYQKVYPTPIVFHALMRGVLQFAGFERAMDIYYEMKEDGWGLDMLGLSRFLDDCIHRADWEGGLLIWEEIANIHGRIKTEHLTKAYAQFLSLCSVAGKPAAFNSVLNDVVRRGYDSKSILRAAQGYTYASRQKTGYLAPAWTADNLLIAVSDYMGSDGTAEADTAPFFEEMNAGSTPESEGPNEQEPANVDDPWAAWLEHELGENPLKETAPTDETEIEHRKGS